MAASESLYVVSESSYLEKEEELDSLPSLSTDEIYSDDGDDDDDDDDAQAEWERSLQQVQMLLTLVLVPWMGKYFGRKFAYWSWARYMNWAHNVEVKFTDKKAFKAVGAVEAAGSL